MNVFVTEQIVGYFDGNPLIDFVVMAYSNSQYCLTVIITRPLTIPHNIYPYTN